ncbi:MAG: hypothetical protein ABIZ91_10875, partial [Gemmatimonadaceae bacterium]
MSECVLVGFNYVRGSRIGVDGTDTEVCRDRASALATRGGVMDVLVMLEDRPEHSTVLAHVNSVPSPLNSERPSRDVVTLYGETTPESLALALAAAVEAHREPAERSDTIRHVSLWPESGAVGDAAWRDESTGDLVT